MLKIKQSSDNHKHEISLKGAIDEFVEQVMSEIVVPPSTKLVALSLHEVDRVNSVGIARFAAVLTRLAKAHKIEVVDCSTVIVDVFNLVPELNGLAELKGIRVPYSCRSCRARAQVYFRSEQLDAISSFDPVPCEKCQAPMEANVDFDSYTQYRG